MLLRITELPVAGEFVVVHDAGSNKSVAANQRASTTMTCTIT